MDTEPVFQPSPIPIPDYRRRHSNYFFDFSPKRNDYVEFEGPLERNFWILQESNPNVTHLCPQPLKIEERIAGRMLYYTFDLWTRDSEGVQTLWDVKESAELVEDINGRLAPAKWPLVEIWARHRDVRVAFVTEVEVSSPGTELLITNWTEMLRFIGPASPRIIRAEQKAVLGILETGGRHTIDSLLRQLYRLDPDKIVSGIVRLIHSGSIVANVDARPFNGATELYLPHV